MQAITEVTALRSASGALRMSPPFRITEGGSIVDGAQDGAAPGCAAAIAAATAKTRRDMAGAAARVRQETRRAG